MGEKPHTTNSTVFALLLGMCAFCRHLVSGSLMRRELELPALSLSLCSTVSESLWVWLVQGSSGRKAVMGCWWLSEPRCLLSMSGVAPGSERELCCGQSLLPLNLLSPAESPCILGPQNSALWGGGHLEGSVWTRPQGLRTHVPCMSPLLTHTLHCPTDFTYKTQVQRLNDSTSRDGNDSRALIQGVITRGPHP